MREKTLTIGSFRISNKIKMALFGGAMIFAVAICAILWNQARAENGFSPNVSFAVANVVAKQEPIEVANTSENITIKFQANDGFSVKKREIFVNQNGKELKLNTQSRCQEKKEIDFSAPAKTKECSFKLTDFSQRTPFDKNVPNFSVKVVLTSENGQKFSIEKQFKYTESKEEAKEKQTVKIAKVENLSANKFVKRAEDGSYKVKFSVEFSDNVSREDGAVKCYLLSYDKNGDAKSLDESYSYNNVADCSDVELDLRDLPEGEYGLKAIINPWQETKLEDVSEKFKFDKTPPVMRFYLTDNAVQNQLSVSRSNYIKDWYLKKENNDIIPTTGCYIKKVGEKANLFEGDHFWHKCGVEKSGEDEAINGPLDLSSFEEGKYVMTGWAIDEAGNKAETPAYFEVDRTAPTVSFNLKNLVKNESVKNFNYLNVNPEEINANEIHKLILPVGKINVTDRNHDADGKWNPPVSTCEIKTVAGETKFSSDNWKDCGYGKANWLDISDKNQYPDGEYIMTLTATDFAKNTTSKSLNFRLDRTAPTGLNLTIDKSDLNKAKITLKADMPTDDISGVDDSETSTRCLIRAYNDDLNTEHKWGDKVFWSSNDCFDKDGVELDLAELIKKIPEEVNALYVYANSFDKAGNKISTNGQRIPLDRTAPVIQNYRIQNINEYGFLVKNEGKWTVFVGGNIFDVDTNSSAKSAGCSLKYNGQEIFARDNGVWNNCRESLFENVKKDKNIDLTDGNHDGDYELIIWAEDYFGNRNEFSQTFKLDTKAPIVSFKLNGVDKNSVVDKNNFVEIADGANVADENILSKLCTISKINSNGTLSPVDGYENVDFVKCGATIEDKTKVDVANWSEGKYRLTVIAEDKANNTAEKSVTFAIVKKASETPENPGQPANPTQPTGENSSNGSTNSASQGNRSRNQSSTNTTPEISSIVARNVANNSVSGTLFANAANLTYDSTENTTATSDSKTEENSDKEDEVATDESDASIIGEDSSDSGEVKGLRDDKTWAVMNLIAVVLTSVIAVVAAVRKFLTQKFGTGILLMIPAVVAVITFLLTEDWRTRMIWFDNWTLLMAVILVAQVIAIAVSAKNSDQN